MTLSAEFYGADLSHIHHHGFGDFARNAAPAIVDRIHAAGFRSGRVVDLGCGSGILSRALVDAGLTVTGVDVAPAMIAIARSEVPEAEFVVGSVQQTEIPPCVAVVALGETLCYQTQQAIDLPSLFRRAHRALEPGGLLLFDLIVSDPANPMNYQSTRQGSGWTVDVEVTEDAERSVVTRRIQTMRRVGGEARRSEEIHRARTFDGEQVVAWLEAADFTVATGSAYGDQPLAERRVAFLCDRSA